jgi:hypothetical protein
MGQSIASLLRAFKGRVPDLESNGCVLALAEMPERWSAGHKVFDEVRRRLLSVMNTTDQVRQAQYYFEESCCQAMYNATSPPDEFDTCAPFFIAPNALWLARRLGMLEAVLSELAPMSDEP